MEINGLPLHPLVVHAAVVLAPLAALAGLLHALAPRWRWASRWPLVGLATVAAGACVAAYLSGQALLEARPELTPLVATHQERGELLMWLSISFVVDALLAAWALGGPSALASGRGARESHGTLSWPVAVLLVVGSLAMLVMAVLTGDSGARAVWA